MGRGDTTGEADPEIESSEKEGLKDDSEGEGSISELPDAMLKSDGGPPEDF